MEVWLLLAVGAPLLWAISNLVDTELVEHHVGDSLTLTSIGALFCVVPAAYFVLRFGWPILDLQSWSIAIGAGLAGVFTYWPYLAALRRMDTATVVLLWNLSPVITLGLAAAMAMERLSLSDYLGMTLLVAGGLIGAQIGHSKSRTQGVRPAALLMTLAAFLYAVQGVLEKLLYQRVGFESGVTAFLCVSFLVGIMLVLTCRRIWQPLRLATVWPVSGILGVNQILDALAGLCLSAAISMGPLSVVRAVGALQALFVAAFELRIRSSNTTQKRSGLQIRFVVSCVLAALGLLLIRSAE